MAPKIWKQTSEEERRHIVNLYLQGKSYRVIAEQTGRCQVTCVNVVRDYERNRAVKTERKRSKSHTDCSPLHRVSEMEETVHISQRDSTKIVG